MEHFGLYNTLEKHFGDIITVNRKNNSPVNQKSSSMIRHNYQELYENHIVAIDLKIRECFTKDIFNYFVNHPETIYEFISDMLNKNSGTCIKNAPDRLIVLNYSKNKVKEIDIKHFYDNIDTNIKMTDTGLVIGNVRIAISWQNGVGLNNPTIRVFLED
jgi:hypothetical protein